ncbi:MAG TPA: TerC/Alx family metal homeostasis membrane protein [Polyangiaceae bacterium]|jgi:tellurite resistance protein TerC|nr:TerC/Alx family metal homeostasis membrane protein [Polyangiaceae bacterium]
MNSSLQVPAVAWLVFAGVVLASLAADLLGHRRGRGLGRRGAIVWSLIWVSVALLFGGWVWVSLGRDAGEDFLTAWLIEKSLSIDNLFVFLVIFERLRIPQKEQHRVLFWGIIGAFVTRAAFIASGAALLAAWHGAVYVLGAFLVYTGLKTLREHAGQAEADEGRILRLVRRLVPFTSRSEGGRFFVVENGKRSATPLLMALIVIETSDIVFAIDSIPAVFSVTSEPFIVYTSNVFAILGMRALYLVLADLLSGLKYLRYALSGILVLAGAKMLLAHFFVVPHAISLLAIAVMLAGAIVPSVIERRRVAREARRSPPVGGQQGGARSGA